MPMVVAPFSFAASTIFWTCFDSPVLEIAINTSCSFKVIENDNWVSHMLPAMERIPISLNLYAPSKATGIVFPTATNCTIPAFCMLSRILSNSFVSINEMVCFISSILFAKIFCNDCPISSLVISLETGMLSSPSTISLASAIFKWWNPSTSHFLQNRETLATLVPLFLANSEIVIFTTSL